MARSIGSLNAAADYEVAIRKPLDSRRIVASYEDLTTETTWLNPANAKTNPGECHAYNGMLVAVVNHDLNESGFYYLFDKDNRTPENTPDVTNRDNWHKFAELSEIEVIRERLEKVETFFNVSEGEQLDKALDTLVEIQQFLETDSAGLENLVNIINQQSTNIIELNTTTKTITTELGNKVDKAEGHSLVSDDEIARLANVNNYDDTVINERVTAAESKIADLETESAKHALKTEVEAVDAKFESYKTAVDQEVIDEEQDRRLGVIEGDYVKAAHIANFETKDNVKKVADDLVAYEESNDAAVANRYTKEEADGKFALIADAYDDTDLTRRVTGVETKTTNIGYNDGQTSITDVTIQNGSGDNSLSLQDLRLEIKYQSTNASRACISMGRRYEAWNASDERVEFPVGPASTAIGAAPVAEGRESVALGEFSWAEGNQQVVVGHHNKIYDASSYFIVGNGTYGTGSTGVSHSYDNPARSNAFRVTSDGNCHAGTSFVNGGANADFAEYFEWADGNPGNEDRRGRFVTLDGEKIKLASQGDNIIGVISATGAFIGNSASEDWNKKYLTDIFGAVITEAVEIPEEVDPQTGEILVEAHTEIVRKLNPEFDMTQHYIPRSERPEWAVVGLVGQIVAVDDGTCVVGGRIKPGINGIGTASTDSTGYIVMKRLDETHVKVLVK